MMNILSIENYPIYTVHVYTECACIVHVCRANNWGQSFIECALITEFYSVPLVMEWPVPTVVYVHVPN